MRYRKLLLVPAPAGQAYRWASLLARQDGAHLAVLAVRSGGARVIPDTAQRAALQRILRRLRGAGLRPELREASGEVGTLIAHDVADASRDLVILDVDRDGHASTRAVMRRSDAPVLVVGPNPGLPVRQVAVAVDMDPLVPAISPANRQLLRLAGAMAHRFDAQLHVLHAWQFVGEASIRAQHPDPSTLIKLRRREFEARRELLMEQLGTCRVHGAAVHVRQGPASRTITELAGALDVDLMIVGTAARRGLAGLLIGNTAEALLAGLLCALLVVPSPGEAAPDTVQGLRSARKVRSQATSARRSGSGS